MHQKEKGPIASILFIDERFSFKIMMALKKLHEEIRIDCYTKKEEETKTKEHDSNIPWLGSKIL